MRIVLGVVATLATMMLAGCGGDDDKSSAKGADKASYCSLVKESLDREPAQPPPSLTEADAKAVRTFVDDTATKEVAFTKEVAAAAPKDLVDEWQSVVDVQEKVAANGQKLLSAKFWPKFKKMSENERAEWLFTNLLGPYAELDEKKLTAIADHAESECGVKGLFGDE